MIIPKVSIHCISYNQEKYIAQALESFVMQKTNFPFEVVIGDDASTDKTQEIIKKYADKYPNIIKPTLREKNIGSRLNSLDIFSKISSKYVSLCEGDDFFTDPLKLQKQVDFLDSHSNYSICFHPVKVFFEDKSQKDYIFPNSNFNKPFDLKTLLKTNFIQTNSCMYRWRFNNENMQKFYTKLFLPGDWYLHLLHAQVGKIGFINEVMSAYRKHPNGIWYVDPQKKYLFWYKNAYLQTNFFELVKKNFNVNKLNFECHQAYCIRKLIFASIKLKDFSQLQKVLKEYKVLSLKLFYLIPLTYIKTIIHVIKKI